MPPAECLSLGEVPRCRVSNDMQRASVRERTPMHVSLNCPRHSEHCAANPPRVPCMHACTLPAQPAHSDSPHPSSASHIRSLEPPKGGHDGSSSPGTGPRTRAGRKSTVNNTMEGCTTMKLGGSAIGPGQHRPGGFLSHTTSKMFGARKTWCDEVIGIFDIRGGNRTICPNAIQCSSESEKEVNRNAEFAGFSSG